MSPMLLKISILACITITDQLILILRKVAQADGFRARKVIFAHKKLFKHMLHNLEHTDVMYCYDVSPTCNSYKGTNASD